MSTPTQEIKKVSEIKDLVIPPYQRPYKWKAENVIQLLDDILEHVVTKGKIYRIGNLILHSEAGKLNVVDGQQRLTTLTILLYKLNKDECVLLNHQYKHTISKNNIAYNSRAISKWLSTLSVDKQHFRKQLLEKCEFVVFTVSEQDEAFQLFDSQNARGKTLEPFDLLKAFHLREMEIDTEADREQAVQRWEKSVDNGELKPILANHLFRIRKWSKNERKYNFTKNDIDEFKGISLRKGQLYPFEKSLRMLNEVVSNAQSDKLLIAFQTNISYPFSITMPIINGKRFFEYVEYYIQQKKSMLSEKEQPELHDFHRKYCSDYPGSGRSGDEKVRNLYENILLLFIDKFGYPQDFEQVFKAFYKAAYTVRCENKSIRLETILNSGARGILREINDAITPEKLKKHQYAIKKIDDKKELIKGITIIKTFINA